MTRNTHSRARNARRPFTPPASARAHAYPIVSAAYAIEHDINPKAIQSVARFHEQMAGRPGYEHSAAMAEKFLALAREVDEATGYYAQFRGRRHANDNRRHRHERRAAA